MRDCSLVGSLLLILASAGADEQLSEDVATKSPASSWQYFCFDTALDFASTRHPGIEFSTLPDPAGPRKRDDRGEEEQEEAEVAASGPRRTSNEVADTAASASGPVDADEPETAEQVAANLASLQGTCFFLRVGYWTYEVCPFASVRQYHSESGAARGAAVSVEHSLGKHLATRDGYDKAQRLYSQHFADGTDGRHSVVRFICPDSWRDEDGVIGVHEPSPKMYVVSVRVHAMCARRSGGAAGGAAAKAGRGGAPPSKATAAATRPQKRSVRPRAPTGPMQIAEMAISNTRILSALRGRCFTMAVGYWTYELCPMQHVRQFRQERNRIGVEFNLGQYDKTADKMTVGVKGRLDPSVVLHTFTQGYTNGTANRRSVVRLQCSRDKNEHALISVEEPAMHQYMFLFSTPMACEVECARGQVPPATS